MNAWFERVISRCLPPVPSSQRAKLCHYMYISKNLYIHTMYYASNIQSIYTHHKFSWETHYMCIPTTCSNVLLFADLTYTQLYWAQLISYWHWVCIERWRFITKIETMNFNKSQKRWHRTHTLEGCVFLMHTEILMSYVLNKVIQGWNWVGQSPG